MALLLPLLLPRVALFLAALVTMAVVSSVAGCGWCVTCRVTLTHVAVSKAHDAAQDAHGSNNAVMCCVPVHPVGCRATRGI